MGGCSFGDCAHNVDLKKYFTRATLWDLVGISMVIKFQAKIGGLPFSNSQISIHPLL